MALIPPFSLLLRTPIPHSLQKDLYLSAHTPPGTARSIWDGQVARMSHLAHETVPVGQEWALLFPDAIRPAAGKLRPAPLMSLVNQFDMGDRAHPPDGFCSTSSALGISSRNTPSRSLTRSTAPPPPHPRPPITDQMRIASTNAGRFSERAIKSGFKNAQALWDEALDQQRNGWVDQDPPLSATADPIALGDPALNVVSRLGLSKRASFAIATTSAIP